MNQTPASEVGGENVTTLPLWPLLLEERSGAKYLGKSVARNL